MKYKFTVEVLKEAINKSLSMAQVCRELNMRPCGGNYKTLSFKIRENNLDISHFTGQGWNVGNNYRPFGKKGELSQILVENSLYKSTNSLKKRLIKEEILEYKCVCCGITDYNNKPIVLELDHINGCNTDNRLENLRLLCPNCHSQTETFRGKSKLSALSEKKEVEYRKFREALTDNADGNPEPSLSNKEGAETRHGTPNEKSMVKV